MSEEMQLQKAEAQAGRSMPDPNILLGPEQSPSQSVQQDDVDDCGESSASVRLDTCGSEEACIPISTLPLAENENIECPPAVDEHDPVEVELDAKLEALLTQDEKLEAKHWVLVLNYKKTRRERRAMRAERRQLHIKEGEILFEIKLHRARKGRGGQWVAYLRQTNPKPLSRTTADRWIKWYLDSQKQEQSQPEPPHGQEENAPQNGSGAFSGGDAESQPTPSDPQQPVATDAPSGNGSSIFEDPRQIILLYKTSRAAHFIAAVGFLVAKMGFGTSHEAVFVIITEAAARLGFVYPAAVAEEGETTNASKGANPGAETPAAGSKAT